MKVQTTPLDAIVSMHAMRLVLSLSNVSDDVVVAAPADRLLDEPMLGMALKRDSGEPLGAFRVLLLVQSTQATDCDPIDEKLPMNQQTFRVTSDKVRCLLSASPVHINLVGYCDFKKMMMGRLGTEMALVLASAVTRSVPGSASATGDANGGFTVTVDHISQKTKRKP